MVPWGQCDFVRRVRGRRRRVRDPRDRPRERDRGASVRAQASTRYVSWVRGVAGGLVSLESATVEVTTPAREPSVINLTVPTPVPDGDSVLSFRVDGTQTLQPTLGTLEVSIDGGPATRVTVEQSTAQLPVTLTPGRTA
jgi:hypothetical protein